MNIVECIDVQKTYQQGQIEVHALKDISLTIAKGEFLAVAGPSGSGKTTLLNLVGGLDVFDAGSIVVDGNAFDQMSQSQLAKLRLHKVGFVFQAYHLIDDLTVYENLETPLLNKKVKGSIRKSMVADMLDRFNMVAKKDLFPSQLSGGMSRRVALARAIALDPSLLMYDEPFTGQDPIAMGVLLTLIKNLNQALKATSLVVSHDVHETLSIADHIYVIADGVVIGEGSAESIASHESARVQQFIHGSPDGPVPFHYTAPDYSEDLLAGQEKRSFREESF